MSLRGLDERLVPRLATALRALLDRLADSRTRTRRSLVAPARRGPLRRLDDRFASSGPLALLRDVPQLGVLLVAAVFLAGAGVAVARNSPESVAEREQVEAEQALPLDLGPPVGADVDDHFATALERVVTLSDRDPDEEFLALVSLRDELTPEAAGALLTASTLTARRAYVRAPVGDGAEVLPVELDGDVAEQLTAVFAETAATRGEEQRQLLELARSIPDGAAESEQRFKAQYEADARLKGLEAAAYRTACTCVIALVVDGPARELAELPSLPSVRGVEVARRGADLPAVNVDPLPPEVTGTRPEPAAGRPGD